MMNRWVRGPLGILDRQGYRRNHPVLFHPYVRREPIPGFVHNRMPVILDPKDFDQWLSGQPEQVVPPACPTNRSLKAYPISKLVNSPRNKSPDLMLAAA